jgi:ATP-binding cassette subfamily B protein
LLLGWLQATQGRILIDGQELDGARLARLRQQTAWVDPAVHLFNRPLVANLLYGAPSQPSESLIDILDAADLRRVLERLPEGLQTPLGEGGGLVSGGEGQRVRLARALFRRDARLVILDEPFRGLDRAQRRELAARARRWWSGATLLCVTHDVAETAGFERVLVVDEGRVVEDGAPAALAEAPSRYRALLAAEQTLQRTLWSHPSWSRLRVERGALVHAERA